MKRLLAIAFSLLLVTSLCIIPASAAESFDLVPAEGATWNKTDNGGASVTVEYQEDAILFSGSVSGTWPCVDHYYDAEKRITANIDEYSIVYDFTVTGGAANINFYFTDGFGTFPEQMPDYETAFVFLDEELNNYDVPPWAMKLILRKDEI